MGSFLSACKRCYQEAAGGWVDMVVSHPHLTFLAVTAMEVAVVITLVRNLI